MPSPEERLADLGLTLPAPVRVPPDLHLPFTFVNVRGRRVLISGHPAHDAKGNIAGPYGKLGEALTTEEGYAAAGEIALSVLADLKAEIGELSRVAGWTRVFGMVNSAPGFTDQHRVVNGFSDMILEAFGADIGRHARSAIGVAGLPMDFAMEIEGELELTES
ncbi:MAG TPA: RidA family protein [Paracoccaceae bacterium]|nr:RidA family protein [Paracoccaceae bacterium]